MTACSGHKGGSNVLRDLGDVAYNADHTPGGAGTLREFCKRKFQHLWVETTEALVKEEGFETTSASSGKFQLLRVTA